MRVVLLIAVIVLRTGNCHGADLEDPEYGDYWEGDIILTGNETHDDLHKAGPLNSIWDRSKRWPNGTLYYEIREDYSKDQVRKIKAGIVDLVESVKVDGEFCVNILPRTRQENYVYIEDGGGCSSSMGMIGGGQAMNLAPPCIERHGTIMHEFLHAFGFHHEQRRSDRDEYVSINWSNIVKGKKFNFFKLVENRTIDLLGTPYDYGSVMHYSRYAFAVNRTLPTIVPHDAEAEIGQRLKLSPLDVERVQIFYDCLQPENSVYFQHLARSKDEE